MKLDRILLHHFTIKFDAKFYSKINEYLLALITKNKENQEFMSSNLYGVHRIRFTDIDVENLFHLFDISETEFSESISKLSCIDSKWVIVNNPFNVLLAYSIMLVYTDKHIKTSLKEDYIRTLGIILQFKMSTQLNIKYVTNSIGQVKEDVAAHLFEKLDNNTLLKKTGSNMGVLIHKSELLYTSNALKKMLKNKTCEGLLILIPRIYNDLNSIHKVLRGFVAQIMEDEEVRVTKSVVGNDESGEVEIKDVENIHGDYIRNIKRLVTVKSEFKNRKLITLTEDVFFKSNHKLVVAGINELHNMYETDNHRVEKLLENIISVSIDYIYNTKLYPPYADRVSAVMRTLKGYWSNSSDASTKAVVKDELYDILKGITTVKNTAVIKNAVIVIAIYVFILSIINHEKG